MPIANRWASDTVWLLRRTPACYTDGMDDKHPTDTGHAPPAHGHGLAYTLIGIFLVALLFGAWGLWAVFAPRPNDLGGQVRAQRERLAILEPQVATLNPRLGERRDRT